MKVEYIITGHGLSISNVIIGNKRITNISGLRLALEGIVNLMELDPDFTVKIGDCDIPYDAVIDLMKVISLDN